MPQGCRAQKLEYSYGSGPFPQHTTLALFWMVDDVHDGCIFHPFFRVAWWRSHPLIFFWGRSLHAVRASIEGIYQKLACAQGPAMGSSSGNALEIGPDPTLSWAILNWLPLWTPGHASPVWPGGGPLSPFPRGFLQNNEPELKFRFVPYAFSEPGRACALGSLAWQITGTVPGLGSGNDCRGWV
jgi:hypothetical protein